MYETLIAVLQSVGAVAIVSTLAVLAAVIARTFYRKAEQNQKLMVMQGEYRSYITRTNIGARRYR